jgi:hypothetical protein
MPRVNPRVERLYEGLMSVIDGLIYLGFLAALVVFFWGLVKFIAHSGDDDGVEEGRRLMVWGVVAFFVLVSIWGIVYYLEGNLGLQSPNSNQQLPGFFRPQ